MTGLCKFDPARYTTAPHQTEGWIVFRESPEKVVYWNPPYCYAYISEGKQWPFKNYVGLFLAEPIDDQSGRLIFREYFDEMGRVEQAILPHGMIALGEQAMGNLALLIEGTEYAMTTVSRA